MLDHSKPFKRVVTHGGKFHADDVCAVAFLRILGYISDETELIRTLNGDAMDKADVVLDVGGKYNPGKGRFDHHQSDFHMKRACGVPYATFGLVVKEFGPEVMEPHELAEFDKRFVRLLDGPDCGHLLYEGEVVSLHLIIGWFMPDWDESEDPADFDKAFNKAVEVVTPIIEASMRRAKAKMRAQAQLADNLHINDEGTIIEMDRFIPWTEYVCDKYPDAHYVIYPSLRGGYSAQVVPENPLSFASKARFPKSWGGLAHEALVHATGIQDARFCHANGFLAAADSLEAIRAMVAKAMEIQNSA